MPMEKKPEPVKVSPPASKRASNFTVSKPSRSVSSTMVTETSRRPVVLPASMAIVQGGPSPPKSRSAAEAAPATAVSRVTLTVASSSSVAPDRNAASLKLKASPSSRLVERAKPVPGSSSRKVNVGASSLSASAMSAGVTVRVPDVPPTETVSGPSKKLSSVGNRTMLAVPVRLPAGTVMSGRVSTIS